MLAFLFAAHLAVPAASAHTLDPATVSVWVDGTGTLYVASGTPAKRPATPVTDLGAALGAAGKGGEGTRVRVHLDRMAAVGALGPITRAVEEAGFADIDLVTDEPAEGVTLMPPGSLWPDPPFEPDALPPMPPLTLRWGVEGVHVGRRIESMLAYRTDSPGNRAVAALQGIEVDREAFGWDPNARQLVLDLDERESADGVLVVLSLAEKMGYWWPVVVTSAWTPENEASSFPWPKQPPLPKAAPRVPKKVEVAKGGGFVVDGKEVPAWEIAWFAEDCSRQPCGIVAVPQKGTPFAVGTRKETHEPLATWIHERPVFPVPGYTASLPTLPALDGAQLGPSPWVPGIPRIDTTVPEPPPPWKPEPMEGRGARGTLDAPPVPGEDGPTGLVGTAAPPDDGLVILGALDAAPVRAVFAAARPTFEKCWQDRVKKVPGLKGHVVEKLVVGADGKVTSASTKATTLNDADTEACVTEAAGKLRFPAVSGGGIAIVSCKVTFGE